MTNEADTCRKFVVPKLQAAGWDNEPHSIAEQRTHHGWPRHSRRQGLRPEATEAGGLPASLHARLSRSPSSRRRPATNPRPTACSRPAATPKCSASNSPTPPTAPTSSRSTTSRARKSASPTFRRPTNCGGAIRRAAGSHDPSARSSCSPPTTRVGGKPPRYYQQIAINRTVEAILNGKKRLLLTMATGTGKTVVAFQICWKLWSSRWNRTGEHRRPRILYLADRNILVDDPKDKTFAAFRRCPPQDRIRRDRQEPGDVLRHLSGPCRGRAPRRPLPGVSAGLLRPHHRR